MSQYRYQLEKYRGRNTRHVCPQCGRKNVFSRYVIVEYNNIYISDIIISIIYTTLIPHGSEIRRGRKSVHSFIFIGEMNE